MGLVFGEVEPLALLGARAFHFFVAQIEIVIPEERGRWVEERGLYEVGIREEGFDLLRVVLERRCYGDCGWEGFAEADEFAFESGLTCRKVDFGGRGREVAVALDLCGSVFCAGGWVGICGLDSVDDVGGSFG